MNFMFLWVRSLIDRIWASILVLSNKYPSGAVLNHTGRSYQAEKSNEIISLMFIDVSGFSIVVEDLTPIDTYEAIKPVMELAIELIQAHGGVIDKTMGDGLFAYFRDKNGRFSEISHADRAMDCGIQIQKRMMRMTLDAENNDRILPLRIGINTASVCIGKLGKSSYLEYGIFGRGVNFAQRLEQACDNYSVMASEATIELATKFTNVTPGLSRKIIKPKNQTELMTVFEIDPFFDNRLLREKAIEKFRISRKLQRRQERIHVPPEFSLQFKCDFGVVELVDFSTGGLSVSLEKYLAKNVDFSIPVSSLNHQVSTELLSRGIDRLWLTVKWAKVDQENFLHGTQFVNLSESQKEFVFHCLEDHIYAAQKSMAS